MEADVDPSNQGEFVVGYGANSDAGHKDVFTLSKDGATFNDATGYIRPTPSTTGNSATYNIGTSLAIIHCAPHIASCMGQPYVVDVILGTNAFTFTKGILTDVS